MNNKKELLWAPWRINYIKQKKVKGCVFCNIYKSSKDKDNYVLLRSKCSFVLLNKYPYNNGHVMIIPNRHIATYNDLTKDEVLDIHNNTVSIMKIFKDILNPQGYNIGANIGNVSGAGVKDHLHMHIVPRWLGDTNFMPVIADTKVIAQSLEQLYQQIKISL